MKTFAIACLFLALSFGQLPPGRGTTPGVFPVDPTLPGRPLPPAEPTEETVVTQPTVTPQPTQPVITRTQADTQTAAETVVETIVETIEEPVPTESFIDFVTVVATRPVPVETVVVTDTDVETVPAPQPTVPTPIPVPVPVPTPSPETIVETVVETETGAQTVPQPLPPAPTLPAPTIPDPAPSLICDSDECCLQYYSNPNPDTGLGYAEFDARCLEGGIHCIAETGCQLCSLPRDNVDDIDEDLRRPDCQYAQLPVRNAQQQKDKDFWHSNSAESVLLSVFLLSLGVVAAFL